MSLACSLAFSSSHRFFKAFIVIEDVMISANELLSSTMKNKASKCSLKKRDMMREKEEIELNECFFLKERNRAKSDAQQ